MPIKVIFDKEIHVVKGQLKTFSDILEFIKNSFARLPEAFQLYYLDSDQDQITLSCDEDLKALDLSGKGSVRIYISGLDDSKILTKEDLSRSSILNNHDEEEVFQVV